MNIFTVFQPVANAGAVCEPPYITSGAAYALIAGLSLFVAVIVVYLCGTKRLPLYYGLIAGSFAARSLHATLLAIAGGAEPMLDNTLLQQGLVRSNLGLNLFLIAWVVLLAKEKVRLSWRGEKPTLC